MLCRCVVWLASKGRPQQMDEGLWKTKRAILGEAETRMRLHSGLRAGSLNVYSTGRGGVGGRYADACSPRDVCGPMVGAKANRGPVSGVQVSVPGDGCYGTKRARWGTQRICCYDGKYLECARTVFVGVRARGILGSSSDGAVRPKKQLLTNRRHNAGGLGLPVGKYKRSDGLKPNASVARAGSSGVELA